MATNSTAQRVGVEVRVAMTRAGVSQSALAQHLGLSQSAVSRRLAGDIPFDVDELTTLAAYLKVDAASLLAGAA